MYVKKQKLNSKYPEINTWTKLYEELTEKELEESTSEEDILNTAFGTLLYFLTGQGDKVLKDSEWVMYLKNDINNAIAKGMFKPSFEDKKHIRMLMDVDEKDASDEEAED